MFLKANGRSCFLLNNFLYFLIIIIIIIIYLFIFFFLLLNLFSLCMQITATIVDAECTPAPTESSEPLQPLQQSDTDEVGREQQMVNSMCQTDPSQVCIKIY
jgi:ABC-type protease/lipase transport system fused ATPase/permease subunit